MSAVISECGQYRYVLRRSLGSLLRWHRPCLFVMLNPSTADHTIDDPTIRRCQAFAKSWSCTQLTVINLFALRATNPMDLRRHKDPIGPENNKYILDEINKHSAGVVVAAWGGDKFAKERSKHFIDAYGDLLKCLGTTKDGSPRHPLYLKGDTKLINILRTQKPQGR